MTGILCPACGGAENEVKDSRPHRHGWRRRRSCACGERFTTLELVVTRTPSLVHLTDAQGGPSPTVRPVEPDDEDRMALADRVRAAVDAALGVER